MIRISKEIILLAVALAVATCGLFALLRLGPQEPPPTPQRRPRVYDPPRLIHEALLDPDFKRYFPSGKDPTGKQAAEGQVHLPRIPLPPAPPPTFAAPPLRPWPVNKSPRPMTLAAAPGESVVAPAASPAASPAAPPVGASPAPPRLPGAASAPAAARPTPDHLLPPEAIEELLKLPEPVEKVIPDRRNEKVREKDLVYEKGKLIPIECEILFETPQQLRIRQKGFQRDFNRADITKIEYAWTFEEQYKHDSKIIPVGDVNARLKIGDKCLENGMMPEALAEYEKAATASLSNVPLALKLAALYRRAGRFEDELGTLRRAADKGTLERERVWLALGDFYRLFDLLVESRDAYLKASQVAPGYADALVAQAEVEFALGLYDRALDTGAKALDRSRGSARAIATRAQAFFALGEIDRAQTEIERLSAGTHPVYAPAANLLGVIQYLKGNYGEAVKSFALAAKTDPTQIQAIANLGVVYLLAGKADEARSLFKFASDRDPADAFPLTGLGLLDFLKSPPASAPAKAPGEGGAGGAEPPAPAGGAASAPAPGPAAGFEKALAVDPRSPYIHYALGMIALRAQDLAGAERLFRASLRVDTRFVPTLCGLGFTLLAAGRGEEAEICLERVATLRESTPDERIALTIARCARESFAKAAEELQQLQDQFPRSALLWSTLAYIDYTQLRKPNEAIKKLETAKSCDADFAYAKETLQVIRDASTRAIWVDDFKRPDSDDVGKLWVEIENNGIDVKLINQKCLFTGTQRLNDWADTVLQREIHAETFIQCEAEFDFRQVARAVVGIRVTYFAMGGGITKNILLAQDDRGRFAFADHVSNVLLIPWKVVTAAGLPASDEAAGSTGKPKVLLRIARPALDENSRNQPFHLYVNDVKVGDIQTPLRDHAARYTVGVFTRSPKNTPVEFAVDNIKIYERKE